MFGPAVGGRVPGRRRCPGEGPAQENPATRRTVTAIFEQRTGLIQRRLDSAVAHGDLPAHDSYLTTQLLCGPVYGYLDQGLQPFTRAEAERIADIVLAGIRHTTP